MTEKQIKYIKKHFNVKFDDFHRIGTKEGIKLIELLHSVSYKINFLMFNYENKPKNIPRELAELNAKPYGYARVVGCTSWYPVYCSSFDWGNDYRGGVTNTFYYYVNHKVVKSRDLLLIEGIYSLDDLCRKYSKELEIEMEKWDGK